MRKMLDIFDVVDVLCFVEKKGKWIDRRGIK